MTTISYPDELPVSAHRAEIMDAVRRHPVVIVCGDTGSGKTTQLPKMCLEQRLSSSVSSPPLRRIAITQPRRLATVTMAERVADELKCTVGGLVGYPTQEKHPVTNSKNIGNLTAKCDVAFAMGGLFGQGGNTIQNYAGCAVNCQVVAPASTLCGIILGTAKTLSGKAITYGTEAAPFKVKGSVKGTALTALLASDGAAVDGVITVAAGGTLNVTYVQYGE